MNDSEKIKALAGLAGWTDFVNTLDASHGVAGTHPNWNGVRYTPCPEYLTSYDAIIPLIKSCWQAQKFEAHKFYAALENYYPHALLMITDATPLQLADALLVATEKMTP